MNTGEVRVIETGRYMELAPLFQEAGFEIHIEGDAPPAMITCWRAEDEAGHLLGGISIEHKGGEFVIGDIAVREDLRGCDIGTLLMQTALKRISEMGGERIYLVAKAPKFFEKFGFTYLTPEEAPDIFNCKTCDQLNVSCHPEFMTYHYENRRI